MDKKNSKIFALILHFILFYSAWAAFRLCEKTLLDSFIENEILLQFIKEGIVKNLIWTVPAVLLINHFKSDVCITLKEMFTSKVNWLKYLSLFVLFTFYAFMGVWRNKGNFEIVSSFGMGKIIVVLFVGLTEEMVFRGWLLNATYREDKKWICISINAVMFLAIHFPIWIMAGDFVSKFTSLGFVSILLLSGLFSWSFIESKNILVPITLHMYWDLLIFMFY